MWCAAPRSAIGLVAQVIASVQEASKADVDKAVAAATEAYLAANALDRCRFHDCMCRPQYLHVQ